MNSGLYYSIKKLKSLKLLTNEDIGSLAARTLTNAYAFDKPFLMKVGRPISTVLNNELIAFAGPKLEYHQYISNSEQNELINFGKPRSM